MNQMISKALQYLPVSIFVYTIGCSSPHDYPCRNSKSIRLFTDTSEFCYGLTRKFYMPLSALTIDSMVYEAMTTKLVHDNNEYLSTSILNDTNLCKFYWMDELHRDSLHALWIFNRSTCDEYESKKTCADDLPSLHYRTSISIREIFKLIARARDSAPKYPLSQAMKNSLERARQSDSIYKGEIKRMMTAKLPQKDTN